MAIVRRMFRFTIIAALILAAGGFVLYQARYHLFPVAVYSRLDMLRQGTLRSKRVAYVMPDRTVFLHSDGLKIAADVFLPRQGTGAPPAILVLHGSSRWGRQIAIIRLLSRKLAERGYLVAAIDFRGFGDSDDPKPVDSPQSWKMEDDIRAGIDYLLAQGADPGRVFIVGHSMGAGYGIYGGLHDERVKKIVAFGPPRRQLERLQREEKAFAVRFTKMHRLKHELDPKLVTAIETPYFPENTFPSFSAVGHKPLLLIDGALESGADRSFLKACYARMTGPKEYVTLPGTEHYLGIVGFEWFEKVPVVSHLMIYDQAIVDRAVDVVDGFLAGKAAGGETVEEAKVTAIPGR